MNKKTLYSNILVAGSVAYDEIMDFPHEFKDFIDPTKLHIINISFVVDRFDRQIGGIATNIAYNLRLNIKNECDITVLSAVGKDGDSIMKFLKNNKISLKGIISDKKLYTATGKVFTDKKDNQIWGYYYGAMERTIEIELSRYAKRKSLLILSATFPKAFLKQQNRAISLGIDYMYDPGPTLSWISPADLLKGVKNSKWVVGNDYEIGQILSKCNVSINDMTQWGTSVITTLGDQGVSYVDKNNNYTVKAYKTTKVIDPTGAGDAWRGGFIASLVKGHSIIDSLKMGNAMASFAVESYGTVNHRPTKKEILKRLKFIN